MDIWLCAGRLSDLRKEDHSSLMPKLSSVMPSLTTGKIARDRSMLCSLDEASSEDEHLHYRDLFSYEDTQTTHPEKDTNQTLLLEHLTQLGTGQSSTFRREL